jgi:drug/metabolite transporter (DMT)-like permease
MAVEGLAGRRGADARGLNPTVALIPVLGLFWGLNWPAVRICLDEIKPWTLRTLGFTLAALLLFGLLRLRGEPLSVPRRHWLRVFGTGLLAVTGYNILSALAQLTASTTRTAVLSYTMPLWTVLFARLIVGERLDGRRMVGLALGAAGLAALGWPIAAEGQLSWGLLFAVGSGLSWAAGAVLMKRYPTDAGPITVAAWQLALGAATTVFGMLWVEGVPEIHPLQARTTLALIYHVIFAQALANAIWIQILDKLPAGIASIASLLVPAVGVIGATLILGERPTAADWSGLVLIVGASAVVLVRFRPAEPVRA